MLFVGIRYACYSVSAAYIPGAAVAKLAYAAGLKSAGDFPVVGSSPTSRTILFVLIVIFFRRSPGRHPFYFAVQF